MCQAKFRIFQIAGFLADMLGVISIRCNSIGLSRNRDDSVEGAAQVLIADSFTHS
jgi:hypothetical protein